MMQGLTLTSLDETMEDDLIKQITDLKEQIKKLRYKIIDLEKREQELLKQKGKVTKKQLKLLLEKGWNGMRGQNNG